MRNDGEGIPADRKSVNFTVTLGAKDRTLSAKDEEKYLSAVRRRPRLAARRFGHALAKHGLRDAKV